MVKEYHGKRPLAHLTISIEIFVFFYQNFKATLKSPLGDGCQPRRFRKLWTAEGTAQSTILYQLCFAFLRIHILSRDCSTRRRNKGVPYAGIMMDWMYSERERG